VRAAKTAAAEKAHETARANAELLRLAGEPIHRRLLLAKPDADHRKWWSAPKAKPKPTWERKKWAPLEAEKAAALAAGRPWPPPDPILALLEAGARVINGEVIVGEDLAAEGAGNTEFVRVEAVAAAPLTKTREDADILVTSVDTLLKPAATMYLNAGVQIVRAHPSRASSASSSAASSRASSRRASSRRAGAAAAATPTKLTRGGGDGGGGPRTRTENPLTPSSASNELTEEAAVALAVGFDEDAAGAASPASPAPQPQPPLRPRSPSLAVASSLDAHIHEASSRPLSAASAQPWH
jgi:hypothetical protein